MKDEIKEFSDSDDVFLHERYSPKQLLVLVKKKYPNVYKEFKLSEAEYIGSGIDAHAYGVGECIVKFTQNRDHARLANQLFRGKKWKKHLVDIFYIAHLPKIKLWIIEEERLNKLSYEVQDHLNRRCLGGRKAKTGKKIDTQIAEMIKEFEALKVSDYRSDAVSSYNIGEDSEGNLKVFDFGYTLTKFKENYEIWK